jgi:hypothetical protein
VISGLMGGRNEEVASLEDGIINSTTCGIDSGECSISSSGFERETFILGYQRVKTLRVAQSRGFWTGGRSLGGLGFLLELLRSLFPILSFHFRFLPLLLGLDGDRFWSILWTIFPKVPNMHGRLCI